MDSLGEPPAFDPLDDVEAGIEQPAIPGDGIWADPLADMLGQVEASVEGTALSPLLCKNPLTETLEQIEKATESQVIKPSEPETLEHGEGLFLPVYEDVPLKNMAAGPFSIPPVPDVNESPFTMKSHRTTYKMRSGGAGIRNSSGDINWCALHQKSICENDDCYKCDSYEPTEGTNDDGKQPVCRYAECNY